MSKREASLKTTVLLSLVAATTCVGIALAQPSPDAAPGIMVERLTAPRAPAVRVGDRIITVVRVDLSRYRLRILTKAKHGGPRPAPRWVREERLAGATNAGMFLPSGRSVGFMAQDGEVVSNRRVTKYRGILGFGPRRQGAPRLRIGGPECGGGIDNFLPQYENVLQAYLMIDCHGRAQPWPNRKQYSVAAFGTDEQGRAVFVHARTPYRMGVFNQMLVDMGLGLRGLVYMEGGPEASLVVDAEGHSVNEMGSYETGFWENDGNRAFWDLPNIVAFQAR